MVLAQPARISKVKGAATRPATLASPTPQGVDGRHGVDGGAALPVQAKLLDAQLHPFVGQDEVGDGESDGQELNIHGVARSDRPVSGQ